MRKFYNLMFKRRLDPRMFMTGVMIAVIVVLILLALMTIVQSKKKAANLVVSSRANSEVEIDHRELSIIDRIEYPIRGDSGETILGFGKIETLVLSPDWKRLATGCDMGVFLWDITGEQPALLKWFQNQNEAPKSLTFSPDGKLLAQGNNEGSLTLWDVVSGKTLFHINAHLGAAITRLDFSSDGARLATGDMNGLVKIWDVRTAKRIGRFSDDSGRITAISFSPDGRHLLTDSAATNSLNVWDIEKEALIFSKQAKGLGNMHFLIPPTAIFSPNGKRILSRHVIESTQPIVVWDVNAFDETCEIERETCLQLASIGRTENFWFHNASFSPDGISILTTWEDTELWDAETGARLRVLEKDNFLIDYAACSPDGQQYLTFDSRTNLFTFRELETGKVIRSFNLYYSTAGRTYFLPDGRHILSGTMVGGQTFIWDVESGRCAQTPSLKTKETQHTIAYSSDKQWLLTQSLSLKNNARHSIFTIWDVQSGEKVQTLKGHTIPLNHGVFSKDGSKVIGVDQKNAIVIWDLQTGKGAVSFVCRQLSSANRLALSPNEQWIAIHSARSGDVELWDIQAGALIRILQQQYGFMHHIFFTPDGESIAAVNEKDRLQITAIVSGATREITFGNKNPLKTIAISPNQNYAAAKGKDGRLTLLNYETMKIIGRTPPTVSIAYCAAVSSDGRQVLTSDPNGCIRLWNVSNHLAPNSTPTP